MTSPDPNDPQVPFSKVGDFVRQLAHDLRNGLNAMDLEAAFVTELVSDPEASDELKKLRKMIADSAKKLQHLSARFAAPHPQRIDFPADEIAMALRKRVDEKLGESAKQIAWSIEELDATVEIDFELICEALTDLLSNALQFREGAEPIEFRVAKADTELRFEIAQAKATVPSEPASWGRDPLATTRRGGYGLGLFHARRIVDAHAGRLEMRHQAGRLHTVVALPLVP